jgi:polyvinyl alcohol dehydrogenase (cytochrome)
MAWAWAMAASFLAAGSLRPIAIAPLPGNRPAAPVRRPLDHDWPKYCADAEMTGQAHGESRISASTVTTMRPAWQTPLAGSVASSPTVVAGRVYVGDWGGMEWVIDASDGHVLASTDLGTTPMGRCAPPVQGITSAAAYDGGIIYLAGGDDSFYALDAATLATVWKTKLGDNSPSGGYYGWSSPSPLAGRLYQGISSHCDDPFIDGRVVALDGGTGATVAAADLSRTSDPTRFGAGVWTSPAIDVERRTVFVTTASAYAYDDGLAYSIVRLSLDDLSIEDFWKIPLEDYQAVPDADWGSSPTLFHDASGRLLVGAGQKDGHYYAFDRADLARGPVWKTPIAIGGDCPTCADGTISTAAFDGTRLYVGGGRVQVGAVQHPGSISALDPATGAVIWKLADLPGAVLAPTAVANGVVFAAAGPWCVAIDASDGRLLWWTDAGSPLYGGVAISDGRVFFGDTAGSLRAFEVARPPD